MKHLDRLQWKHHDAPMRTTLTLDDDLVTKLKELAHQQGRTFKEAVNAAIRRGLTGPLPSTRRTKRFHVKTFHSAFRPGVDPLKLNQLADELEARRLAGDA